uniref:Putative secreted protein n=1 Tax=Ixodes ricinus TaxID=34613 RepID=A0A147BEF8_IXORI
MCFVLKTRLLFYCISNTCLPKKCEGERNSTVLSIITCVHTSFCNFHSMNYCSALFCHYCLLARTLHGLGACESFFDWRYVSLPCKFI